MDKKPQQLSSLSNSVDGLTVVRYLLFDNYTKERKWL